jgi:hypothetical protein
MGAATELWAQRFDGSEFPVEISLNAIDTDQGVLVAAAIRDVTAARQAAMKLRQLLASSADALVGVGPDGRIELLNDQAEILFGWEADELIGRPIEVLVPESAIAVHQQHRSSYVHDPVMRPMGKGAAMSARRRDGSEFPAEIRIGTIEPEVAARWRWPRCATSPSAWRWNGSVRPGPWLSSASSRTVSRASASSPVGSPTTSTTCSG